MQELVNAISDDDFNLLDMGGYSYNLFKQHTFKGVPEFMLNNPKIPLLMLHA